MAKLLPLQILLTFVAAVFGIPPVARKFAYPPNCDSHDVNSCLYHATWRMEPKGISFEISAKQPDRTWTGIGFTKERSTKRMDLVYGGVYNKKIIALHRLSEDDKKPVVRNLPRLNPDLKQSEGRLVLKFVHPIETNDENDFTFADEDCYYFYFPIENGEFRDDKGSIDLKSVNKGIFSDIRICPRDLKDEEVQEDKEDQTPTTVASEESSTSEMSSTSEESSSSEMSTPSEVSLTTVEEEIADLGEETRHEAPGEWKFPLNCDPQSKLSCVYRVTWVLDRERDVVKFRIQTRQDRKTWTGIGFSLTKPMREADVVYGFKDDSDEDQIVHGKLRSGEDAPEPYEMSDILEANVTYTDGHLGLDFEHKLTPVGDDIVNFMENCYYLVLPVGGGDLTEDSDIGKCRKVPKYSDEKICFGNTVSTGSTTPHNPRSSTTSRNPSSSTTSRNRSSSSTSRNPSSSTTSRNPSSSTTSNNPSSSTSSNNPSSSTSSNNPSSVTPLGLEPIDQDPEKQRMWAYPSGCDHSIEGDCDYVARWFRDESNDVVNFTVETRLPELKGYVGIGFVNEPELVGADFIYVVKTDENDLSAVRHGHIEDATSVPVDYDDNNLAYDEARLSDDGKTVVLHFSHKPQPSDPKDFPFGEDDCYHIVFPYEGGNLTDSDEPSVLDQYFITPEKICFRANESEVTAMPDDHTDEIDTTELSKSSKRVCYYSSWSESRPGEAKFLPHHIDPSLCTHLIFAFATLKDNRLAATGRNDDNVGGRKGLYEQITDLKKKNSNLKILLAVGGWDMDIRLMTEMLSRKEHRDLFVRTSIEYVRKRHFDGLDLMFEYPGCRGSPSEDKDRFTLLVKELRMAFREESSREGKTELLLTADVSVLKEVIDHGYNVREISDHLDFMTLLSYDLHGSWETVTGHQSPLFPAFPSDRLNVQWAAENWVRLGAPKEKLVIGMPTYGRGFILKDSTKTDIGSRTKGPSPAGKYTKEPGLLAYFEICPLLNDESTVRHWSDEMKVPYIVRNDVWIGYDDQESLKEKVTWLKEERYGGYMVWISDFDDFTGDFCGEGPYPLIRTLSETMLSEEVHKKIPLDILLSGRSSTRGSSSISVSSSSTRRSSSVSSSTRRSSSVSSTTPRSSSASSTTPGSRSTTAGLSTTPGPWDIYCRGKPDGRIEVTDCDRYVECSGQRGTLTKCPRERRYFSIEKAECVPVGQLTPKRREKCHAE